MIGRYDLGTIHGIINNTTFLQVAFSPGPDEPFPAILPMIGVMASYEHPSADIDEPLDCYVHGYVTARLMKLAKDSAEGLPVTVCATKVDGYVLALTPFSHSYNYQSAVLQGYAKPVEDREEKLFAMKEVTNKVIPQRWETSRTPPDNGELQSTTLLRIKVVSGSGKIRDGGPHDDAKDMKNEAVKDKVWTGVVPIWETYGQPVPSEYNKVSEVSGNISEYLAETQRSNEEYAVKAAQPH